MRVGPAPRVRALAIHAGYRCRNTGVCCSSGWAIPVEPEKEKGLRAALRTGSLHAADAGLPRGRARTAASCFRAVPALPHGARVVLETTPAGCCAFLEPDRRCAVHRQLGEEALPTACRHFPRIVTLTPLGVSVTLSHYCPTAAALLFRPVIPRAVPGRRPRDPQSRASSLPSSPHATGAPRDDGLAVVEGPPAFPASWPWEGLEARDALPPLLRPGVLMDWPSLERWERFAVSALAEESRSAEDALSVLEDAAEAARRWTPKDGAFDTFFESVLSSSRGRSPRRPTQPALPGMRDAWHLVASTAPHRDRLPSAPQGDGDADARWVAADWSSLARPVRRWLATKAFASWLALQGQGLRTVVHGLHVARAVLRVEAARGCAAEGRPLDERLLEEAIRRADLLLVHLADPEALARELSRGEAVRPAARPPGRKPTAW